MVEVGTVDLARRGESILMIRKVGRGYRVVSHKTGKNLGTYGTKAAAKRRLMQLKRHRRK